MKIHSEKPHQNELFGELFPNKNTLWIEYFRDTGSQGQTEKNKFNFPKQILATTALNLIFLQAPPLNKLRSLRRRGLVTCQTNLEFRKAFDKRLPFCRSLFQKGNKGLLNRQHIATT